MPSLHPQRFPNESAGYRAARDRLLRAEITLRRQIEKVAAMRRRLPAGGVVPQDYAFEAGEPGHRVRLSELFGEHDTLVAYSFMFAPHMAHACPMCTSMLDGLDGNAPHIEQRTHLVVIAKSPLERVLAFARERGWRNLRLLSSAGTSYNHDYRGEGPDGSQWPMLNVFGRRRGKVRHLHASELFFARADRGQNPRHVDLLWPLWQVLDLTPEGRGADWYPRLRYG